MAVLLLLAGGDVGKLRPESLLHLLHLLDALHRGGDPGLEDRLGAHGAEAGPQAVLDLAHDALLHRPEIGQAEEGARFLGRAGHFDVYFHARSLSVYASLEHIVRCSHAMMAYGPPLTDVKTAQSTQASLRYTATRRH